MTGANPLAHAPAFRIHFDDSTPDHGPLRVTPGKPDGGILSDEAFTT